MSSGLIPPRLCAVVARSRNGVIGRDGDLPWHLSSDLQHFKRLTMGKPCIMGRKTWDSLPGILPGRPHLILTRDHSFETDKAEVFYDIKSIVARGAELSGGSGHDQVMIIGGAQIYRLMMPYLDRIYETEVLAEIEGDARFEPDMTEWRVNEEIRHAAGPRDDYDFITRRLDRLY